MPRILSAEEYIPPSSDVNGASALLKPMSWEQLRQPVDYADNLLGDRFLERGQGCLLYGPAGCGKSVAGLQCAVHWAAGLDGLHLKPVRPLRTVIIQTEDSLNDTRESLDGILSAIPADKIEAIKSNLVIPEPVPGGSGEDLRRFIVAAATEYGPDMVLVNPLLAFCPGDPTRELGGLLYQVIDPVIKAHRLGFLGVHHTTKTNNRDTSGYGAHDHQYLAAGDARVANWPRAMIQIEPMASAVYRFRISKRWRRAGWTWNGEPTAERYFKHSTQSVRWGDATPDEAAKADSVQNYRCILEVLPAQDQPGISRERVRELVKQKFGTGKNTVDSWLKLGQEDQLIERIEQSKPDSKRTEALFRRKEPSNG